MKAGPEGSEGSLKRQPSLTLARYRFRFKPSAGDGLPAYAGSAWRGALGHALKRAVCVTHLDSCPDCLLYRSCPYPYIFETPPPPGAKKMRKYTAAPHPFLLQIPPPRENGEHQIGLILIGRGAQYLPYFVHAFQQAGQQGLGKARVLMTLLEVEQAQPPESDNWVRIYRSDESLQACPAAIPAFPAAPSPLRIHLQTPVRLQRRGHLVTPKSFQFSDFFGALLRRISMLTYFHTDRPLETDFAGLMQKAQQVELAGVRLGWQDWTRYSSRQKTTMQMGGLVGEIILDLVEGSPFWPYLWLGQWVHVGKGTSMGLGQYTIQPASLPEGED